MAKIVKLKIPLIFFSEFCPSNNSRPVLMLIVTQEKRLGVNIWPIIGIIEPGEERLEEISVAKSIFNLLPDVCQDAFNIMFFHKSYIKTLKFEEATSMKYYSR